MFKQCVWVLEHPARELTTHAPPGLVEGPRIVLLKVLLLQHLAGLCLCLF